MRSIYVNGNDTSFDRQLSNVLLIKKVRTQIGIYSMTEPQVTGIINTEQPMVLL